jgi:hypothetical protein
VLNSENADGVLHPIILNSRFKQIMVEATQAQGQSDDEQTVQKNFTEDPAILDKFKAASLITDGTYRLYFCVNLLGYRGFEAGYCSLCGRSRHLHRLLDRRRLHRD